MPDNDDLEDARSREENLRYVKDAQRTKTFAGRWVVIHSFRATASENIMAFVGAIMLLAVLAALLLSHFGLLPRGR